MTAFSGILVKRSAWQTTAFFTLAFWLSSSLILDLVIMPSLYATGMMTQAGFATAGYSIFWIFNRIELLCAAFVLTSFLVLKSNRESFSFLRDKSILLSASLLTIALIYTYLLSPEMSALGLQLDLFAPVAQTPETMTLMHGGYWGLELIKFILGGTLLTWCYRQEA